MRYLDTRISKYQYEISVIKSDTQVPDTKDPVEWQSNPKYFELSTRRSPWAPVTNVTHVPLTMTSN